MTTLSPQVTPTPRERPRAVSNMSFASNRSRRSSGSGHKLELTESAKEKKRILNTKADPSKAITEAQPAAVALEQSNLDNLRVHRHRDSDGNVITDPDRSNPTRHRLERPLDTIRQFNAAAEGTSSRRASSYHNSRPASTIGMSEMSNRRTSYYGPGYSPQRRTAPSAGGYYRNNHHGFGPQSTVDENSGSYQQYSQQPMRSPGNPYRNGYGESQVSAHTHQQSYETMTSGSDENGKSTNPSSQNSSFDRLHQMRKPDEAIYDRQHGNAYPQSQPYPQHRPMNGDQPYMNSAPPPPPKAGFAVNNPRAPIKLNGSQSTAPPTLADLNKSQQGIKRQSWIKRTFSRRGS